MCIGPDDGCQVVPEPIAPIDTTFVSLEPTRISMSLAFIIISGPMFMDPIPCMLSMPGIFIPGMFCIPGFIVERDRLLLRRCLVRWVLDIFMPGIFIPGMFAILCFFAAGFFLDALRFFCELLLPTFIPGIFFISCAT